MSYRYACLLDTETTGLSAEAGDVAIEVAVQLYDLHYASPVASFASLIRHDSNGALAINGITLGMLASAPAAETVWGQVAKYIGGADVVIAQRAEFDRAFCPPDVAALKPWCCSKNWCQWPCGKLGDGLVSLALAHGVGVVSAHRAMTDVDTLSRLMTRVHAMLSGDATPTPLVDIIDHAMRPRAKVAAIVSYEDREIAKTHGFTWEPAAKRWSREIPVDEIAALPFQTRPL